MLRYMKLGLLISASIAAFTLGCTDRGTNEPDRPMSKGGPLVAPHDFTRELYLQIRRNPAGAQRIALQIRGYMAAVSIPPIQGGQPQPSPLLILLPPQDGDQWYFINHGLMELADELIGAGIIQPMVIACVENDKTFGGYFYAGMSPAAGYYDELIGRALVDYLYDQGALGSVDRSLPLGIGGVGMGAYGAFRAALLNPGRFTSITVTDGPLDFDGPTGNEGFVELFDDALIEQGLLGTLETDTTWQCDLFDYDTVGWNCNTWYIDTVGWECTEWQQDTLGDSTCIDSTAILDSTCIDSSAVLDSTCIDSSIAFIDTTSWRERFDSSGVWHLSRLFIGGALAFSPHDTFIDTTGIVDIKSGPPPYWEIIIPQSQRFTINDSVTLITNIVKADEFDFDFHLPFDSTGSPYPLIWDMWKKNNLESILLRQGFSALRGLNMWFGTTPEYRFGNYRQQTLSWINWLRSSPVDQNKIHVKEYKGYAGNPATNNQYIYDLMRDMLIFHSKCFEEKMRQ
ncbi:MAG: hypothetical protein ACE5K8_06155 [Candidatus Zixiibacteriota bacterium]